MNVNYFGGIKWGGSRRSFGEQTNHVPTYFVILSPVDLSKIKRPPWYNITIFIVVEVKKLWSIFFVWHVQIIRVKNVNVYLCVLYRYNARAVFDETPTPPPLETKNTIRCVRKWHLSNRINVIIIISQLKFEDFSLSNIIYCHLYYYVPIHLQWYRCLRSFQNLCHTGNLLHNFRNEKLKICSTTVNKT